MLHNKEVSHSKGIRTMASSGHLLVVAFDFGTTYSGYAFSFRDDPSKIQTNTAWNSGTEKLISLKTSTCVLLTPDKVFHSFGFEAENKYCELTEEDQHHGWLLFRRFKMLLHNNEHLSRATTVEDINGVSMPARTIFTMSIRYLRTHFRNALNLQMVGVEESDIKYVLTVPAIWNDNAKQFMREAAVEAGIVDSRLKLCLEPEAASVWCQILKIDVKANLSKAGTQYMVVDLGGGTADISVHEKQIDNTLKELHKSSGGPWGGIVVDNNFIQWLTDLFGETTMKQFKEKQMEDYFNLLRDFETKKRGIKADTTGKITFRISVSLKDIYANVENTPLQDKVSAMGLCNKVTYAGDKLRLDASIVKEWFADPVKELITYVKKILDEKKMQKVGTVLLVGGFAESSLVQVEMKNQIKSHQISIPNEPGLVVLKGAVRFGHIPDIVSSRIMPFTYGIAVTKAYDEAKHPVTKMVMINNKKKVENIFDVFVRVGEEVRIGQEINRSDFTPNYMQRSCVRVFTSSKQTPEYVTDEGCSRLGMMTIEHPEGDTFEDKKLDVTFVFGDTELLVRATLVKTGREFTTYIDCLS